MRDKEIQLNINLNTPKGLVKKGAVLSIKCDQNNIPLDKFWRARLKDSEIDNCITILSKKTNKKGEK